MTSTVECFINLFSQNPPDFGAADICVGDFPDSASRAGAFAVVMKLFRSKDEETPIRKVLVIAPPLQAIAELNQANIHRSVVSAAEGHFERTLSDEEIAVIHRQVKTIHAKDLRVVSLLEALESATARCAVIILNAASYRDERLVGSPLATASPKLPEDLWIPHLVELARAATEVAKNIPCYILIDSGEAPPHKEENQEALRSVPDCGVFVMTFQNDASALIASHVGEWQEQVKLGNVGAAFKSIDALPEWMNSQKSFLKLQIIDQGAPSLEVLKLLRSEIEGKSDIGPEARLKLARIAQRADDENIAREMLGPAISGLTAQEDLELALSIAADISESSIIDETRSRLETLYPKSTHLLKHHLTEYVNARKYGEILALLDQNPSIEPELKFVYQTLALVLQSGDIPEYANALRAIEHTTPDQVNWARIVCAHDALARREFMAAMHLCLPTEERILTKGTAQMLAGVTRKLLLQRNTDGTLAVSGEQLTAPVLALVRYLAEDPKDSTSRLSLASLLKVETSGSLGLAAVVTATLKLAGSIVPPSGRPKLHRQKPPEAKLDILPFMQSSFEWMAREGPLNLEVAKLPSKLLTAPPDALFENLRQVVMSDQDLRDAPTEEAFENMIFVGVLLAAHTSEPNADLDLLRYAGARLIAANRLQRARDLAEHALRIAGPTPERRRLAWVAVGDIYHRAHNTIESLIAMACVFSVDVSIDLEQMWHETYLLIRILRDLHLTDYARSALELIRGLSQHLEPRMMYEQRVTTLELGIRLSEVNRKGQHGSNQLEEITTDAERHCSELLSDEEEVAPAAAILSSCIYLANFRGWPSNERAISTLKKALLKISRPQALLIEAVTSDETGTQQLLTLAKSIEAARYAEDIAFDMRDVAIAARRFLDTRSASVEVEPVIFAIELLADHAIRGSLIATADSPVTAIGITSERACEVSRAGIRIVFLGMGESGRLIRVNVEDGRVQGVVCEDEKTFSGRKLEVWSKRYPYGYAQVNNPMNLFYTTTDGLGITLSPSPPTILVMDNSLQQLPPNLVRIGDEFAGSTTPIASAPSMSWLWAARKSLGPRSDRRKAWISTEALKGKNSALVMVADRLQECLADNQIALNTGADLPDDLKDSEIVIIAAHGGILPEGRFIQRLSDDANLAMYPAALASAVGGSSIVILFVCSGGRIDSHPTAETTVGLVKDLFDQGCSTVIASPWPLNVGVPPHWLPVFLREWMAGKTPIEAAYLANKNVEIRLGSFPLDCLAMNVFGDPLRRKS
jgi:hypothetical protein